MADWRGVVNLKHREVSQQGFLHVKVMRYCLWTSKLHLCHIPSCFSGGLKINEGWDSYTIHRQQRLGLKKTQGTNTRAGKVCQSGKRNSSIFSFQVLNTWTYLCDNLFLSFFHKPSFTRPRIKISTEWYLLFPLK